MEAGELIEMGTGQLFEMVAVVATYVSCSYCMRWNVCYCL